MKIIDKTVPFSVTKYIMSCFLLYHENDSVLRLVLVVFVKIFALFICPVQSVIHLIAVKKEKLDLSVTENISIIISITSMIIMSSILPFYSKEWKTLLSSIVNFESTAKNSIEIKNKIIFLNIASIAILIYCNGGMMLYAMAAYYESRKCLKFKEENNLNLICITMFPVWLPFQINILTEIIIFALQFIMIYLMSVAGFMGSYLIYEFSACTSLRIRCLKSKFFDIINNTPPEEQDYKLKLWIQDHQSIIKIIEEAKRLTRICLGFGSLSFGLVCASIANQVINLNKPVGAVLHLLGWIAALFMHCHAGQTIMTDTESIAETIYNSKWYEISVSTRKTILIILMRCQKPLTLDALPQGSLNHPLFMMIIKSSYSFLTFLSNTK